MADVATDGAPQVEPTALAAAALAPAEPGAHLMRQAGRQGVRLGHGPRVGNLAEVRLGQLLGARGALRPTQTSRLLLEVVAIVAQHLIAKQDTWRWPAFAVGQAVWCGAGLILRMRADLDNALPAGVEPIGGKQAVEFLPVGTPAAKQGFEAGSQRGHSPGGIAGQHARCVLAFLETNREAITAQKQGDAAQAAQQPLARARCPQALARVAAH